MSLSRMIKTSTDRVIIFVATKEKGDSYLKNTVLTYLLT